MTSSNNSCDHLFFALSEMPHFTGCSRVPYDLAGHIASRLGISPTTLDTINEIEDCLSSSDRLLVFINPYLSVFKWQNRTGHRIANRLVSIGISAFDQYSLGSQCDIFLNPIFHPHKTNRWKKNPHRLLIDYTYTPSRMPFKTNNGVLENKAVNSGKKIAVYCSDPDKPQFNKMLALFEELATYHNYRFLISTSTATDPSHTKSLKDFVGKFSGSELCDFEHNYSFDCMGTNSKSLERFFDLADAIVTSDDTVSTLSDAVSIGKPVFLSTNADNPDQLSINKHYEQEYLLQQALVRQGRLKILSKEAILSDWKPGLADDWIEIGDRIAMKIRERIHQTIHKPNPAPQ